MFVFNGWILDTDQIPGTPYILFVIIGIDRHVAQWIGFCLDLVEPIIVRIGPGLYP